MAHPRTTLRTSNVAPTSGSQTILQTQAGPSAPSATLRLRAEPEDSNRVRWAEDVIDNEGMGKKSSKVCCIYHKPKEPGDSGSESDSSSDGDSDSEPDLSKARKAGDKKGKRGRKHDHDHGAEGSGKGDARKPSPNAYERQPKQASKKEG
ncbi:hypothetical protein LTR36_005251 [Oleoguttula mirabilis]|uniref:Type 1 phosphatases regulator n=1 Tax=Oleoguttula mirabilis TaxID=1507867 RepID=A0AAV9JWH7_9PEZI|nr:hypothetical protein LTR36_005251 [Oleoguttula mirabilis]